MKRTLRFRWTFEEDLDTIWEYLTDSGLLSQWLMDNDFRPVQGHQFEFRAKPQPGWNGLVFCEVTEVRPKTRLAYLWNSGPSRKEIDMSTTVTWTLEQANGGTVVHLVHDGFQGFKGLLISQMMASGWKTKIPARLKNLLKSRGLVASKPVV